MEHNNDSVNSPNYNKEDNFMVITNPSIHIRRERYDELIKAETTLKIICSIIQQQKPFEYKTYKAVAGKYFPEESKGKEGDEE